MNDTTLYAQLLGIKTPWSVREVKLDLPGRQVNAHLERANAFWSCPECGDLAHLHDYEERRWCHLDTCQCTTVIHPRVPRVKCGKHGTCMVRVPWAEAGSRFTAFFEY
jgi:transposase